MSRYLDALEKEAKLNESYMSALEKKRQKFEELLENTGDDRIHEYRHAIHIYNEEEVQIRAEQDALRERIEQERQREPLSSGESEYQAQSLEKERTRAVGESEAAESTFEDTHQHYMVQSAWAAGDQSAESKSAARTAEIERDLAKSKAYHELQVERSYGSCCEESVESGEEVAKATPVTPSQLPPEILDSLKGEQPQRERYRGQESLQQDTEEEQDISNEVDDDFQRQESENEFENSHYWRMKYDEGMEM